MRIVSGDRSVSRLNGKALWLLAIVASVCVAIASTMLQTRNLIEEVVATTVNADRSRNEQLVVSAFKSVHSQLEKVAIDNGHWDDAVTNSYASLNQEWMDGNWGATTAQVGYVYDTSMVIDGATGRAIASFQAGKRTPFATEDLLGSHFAEFTKRLPVDPNASGAATGFVNTSRGLAIAALSTIVPYDTSLAIKTPRPNYLLFLKHLDTDFVADLEAQYLLKGLQIFADGAAEKNSKSLQIGASSFHPVATWQIEEVGESIRAKLWRSALIGHLVLSIVLVGLAIARWSFLSELQTSRDIALLDARSDPLTGLHNRLALEEHIEKLFQNPANQFSIGFCDIDNFKAVNDFHGHEIGDEVIIHAAKFLSSVCRNNAKVYRLGGDEFVLLFQGEGASTRAVCIAAECVNQLDKPIRIREHDIRFGMSIGLASYNKETPDFAALLTRADEAMYAAKKTNGSMWCTFEDVETARLLRDTPERRAFGLPKWRQVEVKTG